MKTFSELTEKQINHNFTNIDKTDREKTLIEFLDLPVDEWESVNECKYNDQLIEYGTDEYLVVSDDEADVLWDEDLQNYIDDCVLCELPENYRQYFDDEKFKSDCQMDGRAHSLNRYDGSEDELNDFYIYRQN